MSVGFMANKKELLPQPTPVLDCRWVRPCAPFVKLNLDGAINLRQGFQGLGVVVRNCNGEFMVVAFKRVREIDAQEVIRCLNALEECLDSDGALVAEAQAYLKLFLVVICQ
ncbi:hypothetical protein Pyn_03185 [Prunus yedoensis var. nudiflora]|uniref:RNase H type-1 domain-containing protein n=1 Tax=Prunus yedoensis var. nudiflora TaxID=2094558 RepID=A0A314ZA11_PRUYE|nr:hypothetical protein Pyn_03185 [Prunus yedoensis var. nudiflora]